MAYYSLISQGATMTTLVLKGSKQVIAQQVANLEGEVREAIVFIEQTPGAATQPVPATVEDLFNEMEPYMVDVGHIDDSREAIYQGTEGE
jgi:hypothetical protein